MVTSLNEAVVSLLNCSAGVLSWTETELAELDQMVVAQLKEKGLLRWFSNNTRLYKSRKESGLGLQSMLKSNRNQVTKLHARLAVMTFTKHGVLFKLSATQKTKLFKQVQCLKRMVLDTTNYLVLIDLEKLESFCVNKENEALQEKILYKVHMNHFNNATVDQDTSSS